MNRGQQLCFSGPLCPEAMLGVDQNNVAVYNVLQNLARNTVQRNWSIVFWVTLITFLEDAPCLPLSKVFVIFLPLWMSEKCLLKRVQSQLQPF